MDARTPAAHNPQIRTAKALVFSPFPGKGNPATVAFTPEPVLDPEGMQEFAKRMQTPVTVFLEEDPAGSFRARFFTVSAELPFCGHGILAAGAAVLDTIRRDSAVIKVADRPVTVRREGAAVTALMPTAPAVSDRFDKTGVLRALGLESVPADPAHPFVVASIGSPKCLVPLESLRDLYALAPDFGLLAEWSAANGVNGVYAYTLETRSPMAQAHARAFNPRGGNNEDGATGVGAGALAWALKESVPCEFRIEQGEALGQKNQIIVKIISAGSMEVGGEVLWERQ